MSAHLSGGVSKASPELRLLVLGNIGCGKTSSADTILDQQAPISLTMSRGIQQRQGFSEGRKVILVEAPRWYWNGGQMEDSIRKETEQAMMLLAPGLHAILLLIPVFQFTEMEIPVPAELEKLFGRDVLNHTLVLLTCGDYLMGKSVEDYLKKEQPGLTQIIERCNGRYHVINNRQRQDRMQVQLLLDKVDDIVQKSGVHLIKSPEEREEERRILERKHELMESYRAKREMQRQNVTSIFSTDTETKNTDQPVVEGVRNEQKNTLEDRVDMRQVPSGLYSTPAAEQQRKDRQLLRTPSYSLNTDGAILSQMSETKFAPKVTSTFHHRINSTEERSPEVSPTPSPCLPVFSSPSSTVASTPAFAIPSASATSPSSPATLSTELRIVLVGRSGAGKSAAGNCILGQEVFRSEKDTLIAVTQECEKKKAEVWGRKVAVVDTPDWFNSEKTPDEVRAQISSFIALSSPGPHAFLLCVPVDQPAKIERQALHALESVFGTDAVQKHTIALFTFADRLRESGKTGKKSVEAYISSERPDLLKLVEVCRDRFHIMERVKEEGNVAELLEKVEQSVKEAGGQCYSSPAFQEAENKVRQRQVEIAKEQRGLIQERHNQGDLRQLNSERRAQFSYMQPLKEEEVSEDEIEKTRDEAEMSVRTMNIESLPPILLSSISPSLLQSVRERMDTSMKMFPQLLEDSSSWVSKGAETVKNSPMWETVGSGAQNVQKMVVDSSAWAKMGASTEHISKMIGERIPMWEKVGSGAQLVANSSMRVGAGIGRRAKNLAQSPVWGQMGSGVKTGAKTVVESPVWGKVGSGAKAGAKMVAESPVWERIGHTAKQVPKVVIGGAVLGLVIGVFLGGVIGGAIGAAAGSAVTEVGRRKLGRKSTLENTEGAAKNVEKSVVDSVNSLVKPEKVLKVE